MPDPPRRSDPGAEQRFEVAFRHHFGDVVAYLRRRLPVDDVDDAAADVFGVAWRRSAEFDDEIPLPWLLGVAYRVTSERYRGRRRRAALVERLSTERRRGPDDPAHLVAADDGTDVAFDAFSRLRHQDQELLRLAALEELSSAEMAEVVGTTPSAVRVRLSRARSRLRRTIAELELGS